jgi:hypothetical protein
MSLATTALLSIPPQISITPSINPDEKGRIEKIIKNDDEDIQSGQSILFWIYYLTLISSVILKFYSVKNGNSVDSSDISLNAFSASFGFFAAMSLLWSATLPSLLKGIVTQRRSL